MLEEPSVHLFNTYRKKGKPANIRAESPQNVGCVDAGCVLPAVRKLLKTGRCPVTNCAVTNPLVYRHEQKIVDTMLACDLLYATQTQYDSVLIISGDDDFLPPIRTAMLRGHVVARFHPRAGSPRASFPTSQRQLLEIDL